MPKGAHSPFNCVRTLTVLPSLAWKAGPYQVADTIKEVAATEPPNTSKRAWEGFSVLNWVERTILTLGGSMLWTWDLD